MVTRVIINQKWNKILKRIMAVVGIRTVGLFYTNQCESCNAYNIGRTEQHEPFDPKSIEN